MSTSNNKECLSELFMDEALKYVPLMEKMDIRAI